jgi:hypothetical protein
VRATRTGGRTRLAGFRRPHIGRCGGRNRIIRFGARHRHERISHRARTSEHYGASAGRLPRHPPASSLISTLAAALRWIGLSYHAARAGGPCICVSSCPPARSKFQHPPPVAARSKARSFSSFSAYRIAQGISEAGWST